MSAPKDCPRCDGPLREQPDGVVDCPTCQQPYLVSAGPAGRLVPIRQAVRRVVAAPPIIGPQCNGRPTCPGHRYRPCSVTGCTCPCHTRAG